MDRFVYSRLLGSINLEIQTVLQVSLPTRPLQITLGEIHVNYHIILFDLFLDDVDEIFNQECDPVILFDDLSINHLLYADDMVILSL